MTRDGILRERLADTLTDALRASLLRLRRLPRRRGGVRGQQAHPAQHACCARCAPAPSRGSAPARSTTILTSTWSLRPALAELLDRGLRPVIHRLLLVGVLLGGIAVPAAAAATHHGRRAGSRRVFELHDARIYESSGLVDLGALMATVNDSGDTSRVFVLDPRAARRSVSPTSTPR